MIFLPSLRRHTGLAGVPLAMLLLYWAWHLKHPLMLAVRPIETVALVLLCLIGLVLVRRLEWYVNSWSGWRRLLQVLLALALIIGIGQEAWFQWQRQQVLKASPLMRVLGAHFLIGFNDYLTLAPLAERGLIGGIYLTRRNVAGRTLGEIRAEIDKLQALRRANDLPPLFVAADQEGGRVNHLSPLLPAQPALAQLAALKTDKRSSAAFRYGQQHGHSLRALGVNLNLSPVVDLKPVRHGLWVDLNTLIHQRAISGDPAVVEQVAAAYIQGMQSQAVQGTLKHFPGLGQVRSDTHHRPASLSLPLDKLQQEWDPFRQISQQTGAAIMVGHVTLTAIDASNPASLSSPVIGGLIRQQWKYQGLILTDDLNMGAVFNRGIANAAQASLRAGADLVLVTYDHDQYYRALYGAHQAYRFGAIDDRLLVAAKDRLRSHWRSRELVENAGRSG